jgi:hypothetical protein
MSFYNIAQGYNYKSRAYRVLTLSAISRDTCYGQAWLCTTCRTLDFHGKSESLYHRDSPRISGYRVQNVSQMNTQSHTSHHIRIKVHNLLHVHYGVHQYKPLG